MGILRTDDPARLQSQSRHVLERAMRPPRRRIHRLPLHCVPHPLPPRNRYWLESRLCAISKNRDLHRDLHHHLHPSSQTVNKLPVFLQQYVNRQDILLTRRRGNTFRFFERTPRMNSRGSLIRSFGHAVSFKKATQKHPSDMRWWPWEHYTRHWKRWQNHHQDRQNRTTVEIPRQTITTLHYSNMEKRSRDYENLYRITSHDRKEQC
jgi:hypothetical protein